MKQTDMFKSKDQEVWEELHLIRRSIRGLFARFNYLEKEWIVQLNYQAEQNEESEKTED